MLCIIDELTRQCLSIRVERQLNAQAVMEGLYELLLAHGPPEHIRSYDGPTFIAIALREWLEQIGLKNLYIEPGSPWENGYRESSNSEFWDEFQNREILYTLKELKALIE